MKKIILTVLMGIGLLFCLSGAVLALVRIMDLGQLVAASNLIFRGAVRSVESRWDEKRTTIWTYVTLRIDEIIKGDVIDSEITLRLPGGAIKAEDIRLQVSGVPQFQEGEEVLLFCDTESRAASPIVGWSQGRLRIRFDEKLGKKVIIDEHAAQLIPARKPMAVLGEPVPPIAYDQFIESVRKIIQSPGGKPASEGLQP